MPVTKYIYSVAGPNFEECPTAWETDVPLSSSKYCVVHRWTGFSSGKMYSYNQLKLINYGQSLIWGKASTVTEILASSWQVRQVWNRHNCFANSLTPTGTAHRRLSRMTTFWQSLLRCACVSLHVCICFLARWLCSFFIYSVLALNNKSASGKETTSVCILLNHFQSFPMKQENTDL